MLQTSFRTTSAILLIVALVASSHAARVEPRASCTDDEIPIELELYMRIGPPDDARLFLPEFSISDAQDNTVYFNEDDVFRQAKPFDGSREPQYESLNTNICLQKDKCYNFFRFQDGDNDFHQFNVTIDGEKVDLSSESPIQVVEFGAYSCRVDCDELRGESVMDIHIYRRNESFSDFSSFYDDDRYEEDIEMAWMLSNDETDTFFASGKAEDIEYQWNTNFHRMCVKADACHKLSISSSSYESGSYLVVLDGVVYGEKKYSFGNQYKLFTLGGQYEDSLLFGPSCSSAECPSGDTFLEIAVTASPKNLDPGQPWYNYLETSIQWADGKWRTPYPPIVEQRNDVFNNIQLRNFAVPTEYKYYDCMDLTNITCMGLEWGWPYKPEKFDGSIQVTVDGEVVVEDASLNSWIRWDFVGCSEAPESSAPGNGVQLSAGIAATLMMLIPSVMC